MKNIQECQMMLPGDFFQSYEANSLAIDADGEKGGFMFQAPKTGTISAISVSIGNVTTAQSLKVSLQGVGGDGYPDGSIKESGNAYGTIDTPVSVEEYKVTLGTPYSASFGEWLSVVVEFSSTTGSLIILLAPDQLDQTAYNGLYSSAAWAQVAGQPYLYVHYSDCEVFHPTANRLGASMSSPAYNSSSTPDEKATSIIMPFDAICSGMYAYIDLDNATDLILYDENSTALSTITLVPANRQGTGREQRVYLMSSDITLRKGKLYRVSVKPTTTSNIAVVTKQLQSEQDTINFWELGADCYGSSRTDSGTWTDDKTQRICAGLYITKILFPEYKRGRRVNK